MPPATLDNMLSALGNGFHNDGDNEITGIHVSDGDPGIGGILGAKDPEPFRDGWRLFWTQQHGDNVAWEILAEHQLRDLAALTRPLLGGHRRPVTGTSPRARTRFEVLTRCPAHRPLVLLSRSWMVTLTADALSPTASSGIPAD